MEKYGTSGRHDWRHDFFANSPKAHYALTKEVLEVVKVFGTKKWAKEVEKFISTVDKNGPSSLLLSGDWCGHGEILFRVYDILNGENNIFKIFISNNDSEELTPTAVKLETISSGLSFL